MSLNMLNTCCFSCPTYQNPSIYSIYSDARQRKKTDIHELEKLEPANVAWLMTKIPLIIKCYQNKFFYM